ncbi:hypothetical protein PCG10_002133 [Penicillium crustosum]|uniref:F-box domain-containing protein n=1 Tax=Penicillium crustosum TaxID=36656 RepID=A0A9P5KZ48_PENCR|nr:hypothetical protein PCG10_002133 [Penicillium crustosum]
MSDTGSQASCKQQLGPHAMRLRHDTSSSTRSNHAQNKQLPQPKMQLPAKIPAQAQFTTPEIVTSILHEMDMRTLIAAQRVCRMWATLIHESLSLQHALFLLPANNKNHTGPRIYNPVLAEAFPSFFPRTGNIYAKPDSEEDTNLTSLSFAKNPTKRNMYLRPEASWRRMLTTQPPIHTIGTFSSSSHMLGISWYQEKAARQKDGLRMAMFFELVVSLGPYMSDECSISICLGGQWPINAHSTFIPPSPIVDSDRINADWAKMLAETDLVLRISSAVSCTDSNGPDDSDWEKSPNEVVCDGIRECYEESGLTLSGLPMEIYGQGEANWN